MKVFEIYQDGECRHSFDTLEQAEHDLLLFPEDSKRIMVRELTPYEDMTFFEALDLVDRLPLADSVIADALDINRMTLVNWRKNKKARLRAVQKINLRKLESIFL